MLIVSSDNWLRRNNKKAYPAVFMSKIMNDNMKYSDDKSKNASSIKKLIELYFSSNILNNNDIMNFFDSQKNHKSYAK